MNQKPKMKKIPLVTVATILVIILTYFISWGFQSMRNRNTMCAQVVTEACFLGKIPCANFPDPCSLPPLWYPKKSPEITLPRNNKEFSNLNPDIADCVQKKQENIKKHNLKYMDKVFIVGFTRKLTRQELGSFLEKYDLSLRTKYKFIDSASVEHKTGNLLIKMCEVEKDPLVENTSLNTISFPSSN